MRHQSTVVVLQCFSSRWRLAVVSLALVLPMNTSCDSPPRPADTPKQIGSAHARSTGVQQSRAVEPMPEDREIMAEIEHLRKDITDLKENSVGVLTAKAFGNDIFQDYGDWSRVGFFVETGSLQPATVTLAEVNGLNGTRTVFSRPMTINNKKGIRVLVLGVARDTSIGD
jgi:hypothetical protein